jgi:hypothetical protein
MSTAKFDTLSNLAGTQSVPVATVAQGSAKAWVNFNGTGTVAIRASFNVSSITDQSTGQYAVNFTTALPDTNYAVVAMGGDSASVYGEIVHARNPIEQSTTAVQILITGNTASARADSNYVAVAVFR